MTWLVVGASGQLGHAVCRELTKRGIKFIGANSSELDLAKPLIVKQLIANIQPSVIVNCGAYTNVDKAEIERDLAWAINAEGPGQLALAAREVGAKLVHISTDFVFSGLSNVPYKENDLTGPRNVYGETKAAGEQNVLNAYGAFTYIFRTGWLYSEDGESFVRMMANMALRGGAKAVNDQVGQPTFAGDLAKQIIISVLAEIPFGIYHATNSGKASKYDLAIEIFRLAGADSSRVEPVSSDAFPLPAKRPAYSVLGHDKWIGSGVSEMRDWKVALSEAMPAIICAVKAEQ